MPEMQLADYGMLGLAIYGVVMIALKLIDLLGKKFGNSDSDVESHPDKLSVLLENNNTAITELTHFLRTQSEVTTERDKHLDKHLDNLERKIDHVRDLVTQHSLDTKH